MIDASFDAEAIAAATDGTAGEGDLGAPTATVMYRTCCPRSKRNLACRSVSIRPMPVASPRHPISCWKTARITPLGRDDAGEPHTPGHTPGCICLLFGETLIAGDTLFPGGPGATRGDKDRFAQIIASITTKLYVLPDATLVRPGHGDDTTIGTEKPHLQERIRVGLVGGLTPPFCGSGTPLHCVESGIVPA